MKRKTIILFVLAVSCLMGAVSCEKMHLGSQIRFKTRTRPDVTSTKTAYSGSSYTVGSTNYERIDWSSGDEIVLAMKNNEVAVDYHYYTVSDISPEDLFSDAGLSPATGTGTGYGVNGLDWGEGLHDFWAAYPSSATVGDHTLSFEIPADQTAIYNQKKNNVLLFDPDMDYAFMVASLQSNPTSNDLNLEFTPAFTAFDFSVSANSDVTVTKFVMDTEAYETETSTIVPLSGTAVAEFDPSDNMSYSFSTAGTAGQTVELTFDDGNGSAYNPIMSTSTSMNFKVFALPQNLPGIRITFYFSDGSTRSLRLKQNDEWITFPARAKVNIVGLLVPGATWYINFDHPRQEQWIVHPDIEIGVE